MRKAVFFIFCPALLIALIVHLSSCSKRDITNPPEVFLNQVAGYIYEDSVVPRGSVVSMWIYANKVGVNDYLDSGYIQRSINNGPDTTLAVFKFASTYYSEVYSYQLGDSGNAYKYTFTFFNENRVSGRDSVVITTD